MLFSYVSFFGVRLFVSVEIDYFIVPVKDLIVGPFKGQGQHVCLGDCLWYRHATPLLDEGRNLEEVQCSRHCHQDEEAQLDHSQALDQVLFATQTRIEILKYVYEQEHQIVVSPPYIPHSPITNHRTPTPEPAPIDFFEILNMWQDILMAHADNIDEDLLLTVEAEKVEDAANAIYYAMREIATGFQAPSLPSTTVIRNADLRAFNAPRFIANMSVPI